MLYSPEELPESVCMSLLEAPHARKIFTHVYERVLRQSKKKNEGDRSEVAASEAWKAVKEAYGLAY